MKNIRKFETTVDMEAAALEECSVSYVDENDKVYTTPENGGQNNKHCTFTTKEYWYTGSVLGETFNFENGMTWGEFIDSDYNVSAVGMPYFEENDGFVNLYGTYDTFTFDGGKVMIDSLIVNGATYTVEVSAA